MILLSVAERSDGGHPPGRNPYPVDASILGTEIRPDPAIPVYATFGFEASVPDEKPEGP